MTKFKKFNYKLMGPMLFVFAMLFANLALHSSTMAQPQTAQDSKSAVCQGIGAAVGGGGDCADDSGGVSIDNTLKRVIEILSVVVAVIAVIMIIIGGLRYITSSGDSGSTTSARNTIIYALVGLLIVALAQVIVRFALRETTRQPEFNLPVREEGSPVNEGEGPF